MIVNLNRLLSCLLLVPSIVVQNGSSSSSSSASSGAAKSSGMEKTHSGKHKSKLSKQAEFEETDDPDSESLYDINSGNGKIIHFKINIM